MVSFLHWHCQKDTIKGVSRVLNDMCHCPCFKLMIGFRVRTRMEMKKCVRSVPCIWSSLVVSLHLIILKPFVYDLSMQWSLLIKVIFFQKHKTCSYLRFFSHPHYQEDRVFIWRSKSHATSFLFTVMNERNVGCIPLVVYDYSNKFLWTDTKVY